MLHAGDPQGHQVGLFKAARRWAAFALPFAAALAFAPATISPLTYLAEVTYLASPELKGRATGSPELEKAAGYIAGLFQSFGLKPADGKNFEEAFPVTLGAHDGPGTRLRYREPEETRNL